MVLTLTCTKFPLINLYNALIPSTFQTEFLFLFLLLGVSCFYSLGSSPSCSSLLQIWLFSFLARLDVGLSVEEAANRLRRNGLNRLSDPKSDLGPRIVSYLFGGCGMILWPAAILSCLAWRPLGGKEMQRRKNRRRSFQCFFCSRSFFFAVFSPFPALCQILAFCSFIRYGTTTTNMQFGPWNRAFSRHTPYDFV